MALRLDPMRLLLADDVGVGKTIEAGMIARELLDRGIARRLCVLCPAYLCDEWERELRQKFAIDAAVARPSSVARLERELPRQDLSVYEHYPHLIASIDFVKAERNGRGQAFRKGGFASRLPGHHGEGDMRAVVCRELAGPGGLRIEDLPTPRPGPGEVRLRVRAAGVNFADSLIITGRYQDKPPLPFSPGMEVAGQIEACGEGVLGFRPGERVMATLDWGGFAEEVVTAASHVVRLPDTIDYVTAAGFAIVYGTAYGALVWSARLQAGETLVVHGAAGGVGLAAVECGKVLGAEVIATARGAEHLAVAREHGADHGIDTGAEDVRARIRELTRGRGAGVVFDPVGGKLFEASLRSIAWEGRLLVIGFASGEIPQIPANLLLVKNAHALGFYWGSYRRHDPARVHAAFEELLGWHAEGRIRPHVAEVLPLEQASQAIELLLARRSSGKVVLTLDL